MIIDMNPVITWVQSYMCSKFQNIVFKKSTYRHLANICIDIIKSLLREYNKLEIPDEKFNRDTERNALELTIEHFFDREWLRHAQSQKRMFLVDLSTLLCKFACAKNAYKEKEILVNLDLFNDPISQIMECFLIELLETVMILSIPDNSLEPIYITPSSIRRAIEIDPCLLDIIRRARIELSYISHSRGSVKIDGIKLTRGVMDVCEDLIPVLYKKYYTTT